MTTAFTIKHIREVGFQMNRELTLESDLKNHLKVAFLLLLQFEKDSNTIGLHTIAKYTYDDQELLSGGATFVVDVPRWTEVSHDIEEVRKYPWVKDLLIYSMGFVSGQHYKSSAGTPLNSVFLPYISPEDMLNMLVIDEVKK